LTDTIAGYTNTRLLYESAAAVVDSANLTFDGTTLSATALDIDNIGIDGSTISNSAADTDIIMLPNGTGVISVLGTTNYEDNITADDDIPNKLYVDSFSATQKIIFSGALNFKTVAETTLYTVPAGYVFLLDEMEVVTTAITGAAVAPTVRFGNTGTADAYWAAAVVDSNAVRARHVIKNPQQGIAAAVAITGGITVASTATTHTGYFILRGTLLAI